MYRFVEQAIDPRAGHHSKRVLIRLLVAFTKSRKLALFFLFVNIKKVRKRVPSGKISSRTPTNELSELFLIHHYLAP